MKQKDTLATRYRKNIGAYVVNSAVSTFYGVVGIGLAMRVWGEERMGIWLLLSSYFSYVTLVGGFGMDNAAMVYLSGQPSQNAAKMILRKVKLFLGSISLILAIFFLVFPDSVHSGMQLIASVPLHQTATAEFIAKSFVFVFLITTPFVAVNGVLVGCGRQDLKLLLDSAQVFAGLLCVVASWILKLPIEMFSVLMAISVISIAILRWAVAQKHLQGLSVEASSMEIPKKKFWGLAYGSWKASLSGTMLQLMDTVALGRYFPVSATALYLPLLRIMTMGFAQYMMFHHSLNGLLVSPGQSEEQIGKTIALFERRLIWSGALLGCCFMIVVRPFTRVWLGENLVPDAGLVAIMALAGIVYLRSNLLYVCVNARGGVQTLAWVTTLEFLIKSLVLVLAIPTLGLMALPLGGLVASVLPNIILSRTLHSLIPTLRPLLPWKDAILASACFSGCAFTSLDGGWVLPLAFGLPLVMGVITSWKQHFPQAGEA